MSDVIHLGNTATRIEESPTFVPYSKVRVIAGVDEDGNQVVYEAGNDSYRTLEVENPWGTQTIANAMLQRIQGKTYKPYTATGTMLNPAAELGDAVYVGGVYSVINSVDTTFSQLMPATIAAKEDSNIDHEFPYETKDTRETSRRINGLETRFSVELGKIESYIGETFETKDEAGTTYAALQSTITQTAASIRSEVSAGYTTKQDAMSMEQRLNSSITQTANSIRTEVSASYETKLAATAKLNTAKEYADTQDQYMNAQFNSAIEQMANRITATVAGSMDKYDEAFAKGTITLYGYGVPQNATAAQYNGQYYLDQSTGWHYKSNGTTWVRQGTTPLPLITDVLESKIDIGVDGITMSVTSDTNGMTTFRLMAGSAVLDTEELYLNVNSANIRGELVADSIIAGARITSPEIVGNLNFYNDYGHYAGQISCYESDTIYMGAVGGVSISGLANTTAYGGSIIDLSNAYMVVMPDNTTFVHA